MNGMVTTATKKRSATKKKEPTYYEELETELVNARRLLGERQAYLRAAAELGMRGGTVSEMDELTHTTEQQVKAAPNALLRIKRVLDTQCEPTTLPTEWYCGALRKPGKVGFIGFRLDPDEVWPSRFDREASWERTPGVAVYRGAIPTEVMARWARVQADFDDMRVYSPRREDFRVQPRPVVTDPVMIGAIDYLGNRRYFEIARWDIDKDLAEIFGGKIESEKPVASQPRRLLSPEMARILGWSLNNTTTIETTTVGDPGRIWINGTNNTANNW